MRLSQVHTTIRNKINKIRTLLWYRFMFKKFGENSCVSAPFFPYNTEFVELGEQVFIAPNVRMEVHYRIPEGPIGSLRIGNRVVIGQRVNISCCESLTIGDDVTIAAGCYISDNNHGINPSGPNYMAQPLSSARTEIGSGVWLGQNVAILAGSKIGERSIIGAGSIVTGEIPPYSIAVGSPARVIKQYCFVTKVWKKVVRTEATLKMTI
ncbi:acetyltransferase-like isoleucine patch superfamily enzyme [Paenibacillus sp. V4I9]|uniref:acyltransferase n=1 Tax=Paenibacillus sp. V4I9 TaxID=3042308 RepID=UPI002788535D|nr:acyltransferase [Paenibacillus sp. V4I9]MDQ0890861.1 acetyltransferase-like isoleucine patch superfamily enzyme [Paenibacillus sp. V4I9]